jgi:hypothetical protein
VHYGVGVKRAPLHWVVLAAALAAVIGFVLLGTAVTPAEEGHGTHEQLGLPPCSTMELFGVPCPGCGVTTSVALAAQGRPLDALRTQPFGLLLALAGLVLIPWALYGLLRGRDLGEDLSRVVSGKVLIPLGVVFIGSWIYKLWVTLA